MLEEEFVLGRVTCDNPRCPERGEHLRCYLVKEWEFCGKYPSNVRVLGAELVRGKELITYRPSQLI